MTIAILDFNNTGGLSPQETVTLGNRLRSMLVKTNAFIVLERGQMDDILTEQDIPHVVTGLPPMFSILLGIEEEPHEFRDYIAGDGELYEHVAYELIKRGVMPDADGREPWFLCAALNEKDVDETLNIFNDSVKAAKK